MDISSDREYTVNEENRQLRKMQHTEGKRRQEMKNRTIRLIIMISALMMLLCACGNVRTEEASKADTADTTDEAEAADTKDTEKMMRVKIGETAVEVSWEDNESVEALRELCKDGPVTVQLTMYGDFEQVGSIGTALPANDEQMTTSAGDIVLYSGDQLVIFYGSNSWAYTKLGHITDQDSEGMAQLLGNGDVTVTISME